MLPAIKVHKVAFIVPVFLIVSLSYWVIKQNTVWILLFANNDSLKLISMRNLVVEIIRAIIVLKTFRRVIYFLRCTCSSFNNYILWTVHLQEVQVLLSDTSLVVRAQTRMRAHFHGIYS